MDCLSVLKFPVLLDIFSLFRSKWPLVRNDRGHLVSSCSQIAAWL